MKTFIGYHCDVARGAYLRLPVFEDAIRRAAGNGYTHFLPYIENMIRLPSMTKACPKSAYTPEQWEQLTAVAESVGVELTPHFNVLGHTERIIPHYPELAMPGEPQADPTREATRDWTRRCLREFCDISRSEYFLIGGDEWQPPNRLLADPEFDIAEAVAAQLNLAIETVAAAGRTPLIWHDMLTHYPKALERLDRRGAIVFWFYDEDSDYPVLDFFKRQGFKTFMASGVSGGCFSRRRQAGVKTAARAIAAHQADGFIMTMWEYNRWEMQTLGMDLTVQTLRGENPGGPLLEAASLWEAIHRIEKGGAVREWRLRLARELEAPVWKQYPEAHEYLSACLAGDRERDLASYLKYHQPEGVFYDRLKTPAPPAFGISVEDAGYLGPRLRCRNGEESFCIYPEQGATLVGWQCGSTTLIRDSVAAIAPADLPPPGGYHSKKRAVGFRPIWGLGCHHNPCIIAQYPYEWEIVENGAERASLRCWRDFHHVRVEYRVTIENGRPGFAYTAKAVNLLEHAYGGWNWNLVLTFTPQDIEAARFYWREGAGPVGRGIVAEGDSFFVIPARAGLEMATTRYSLNITSPAEETSGYYVDWGREWITPDLHAVYRPRQVGEEAVINWHFQARER